MRAAPQVIITYMAFGADGVTVTVGLPKSLCISGITSENIFCTSGHIHVTNSNIENNLCNPVIYQGNGIP